MNVSVEGFTVSGEEIRFGLLAVKNIGRGFIRELIAERESGEYSKTFPISVNVCMEKI